MKVELLGCQFSIGKATENFPILCVNRVIEKVFQETAVTRFPPYWFIAFFPSLYKTNRSFITNFSSSSLNKEARKASASKITNLIYKYFSLKVRAPKISMLPPPPPPQDNTNKVDDIGEDFIHSVKTSLQTDKTTFTPEIKNTTVTPSVTKGIRT